MHLHRVTRADFAFTRNVNGNTVLDAGERQDTTVLCHGLRLFLARKAKPAIPVRTQRCSSWQPNSCPSRTPPARMAGCWCAAWLDHNENDELDSGDRVGSRSLQRFRPGATVSTAPTARRVQHSSTKLQPSYICADGFVVRFGVDDGTGEGDAGNDLLEQDEVREGISASNPSAPSVSLTCMWEPGMR